MVQKKKTAGKAATAAKSGPVTCLPTPTPTEAVDPACGKDYACPGPANVGSDAEEHF